MPKIIINNVEFIVTWTTMQNQQLLAVGKKYLTNKLIDWQKAEADGALKGLPRLSLKKLSCRYSFLKWRLQKPDEYKRKKTADNQEFKKRRPGYKYRNSLNKRIVLWKKVNVGLNPTEIWTQNHSKILIKLCAKYKYNNRIRWKQLVKDKQIQKLPGNKNSLRSKYYTLLQKSDPKRILQRRKDSLEWNRKNKKRYKKNLGNVKEKYKRVRNLTRSLLDTFIEKF